MTDAEDLGRQLHARIVEEGRRDLRLMLDGPPGDLLQPDPDDPDDPAGLKLSA